MRFKYLFLYAAAVFTSAMGIGACGSTANVVNTNANTNIRNVNSNTAVLVNNNSNLVTNSNRWANANVNRADYDRDRANYERDKGDSTIGSGVNDSWIWFKTRAALATAEDLRDSTINVDVENDKITLRGTVGSAAEKAKAETVAKGIEGQKGVTNQLKVAANDSVTNTGSGNGNSGNTNRR